MKEMNTEEKVARLYDLHEIEQLSNLYCRLLSSGGNYWEEIEDLFAKNGPDPSTAELWPYGPLVGNEDIKKMYTGLHKSWLWDEENNRGTCEFVFLHNTTPVIQLAGDRQTAKELAEAPVYVTVSTGGGLTGNRFLQRRATDFIKEDGVWKMWHYRVPGMCYCPADKNWIDGWEQFGERMRATQAAVRDRWQAKYPPSYGMELIWSPDTTMDAYNAAAPVPVPYETFSETFSYASGPQKIVGRRLPLPEHLPPGVKP